MGLVFVFQSALATQISQQEYLINCPLPIQNALVTFGNPQFLPPINPIYLNYTVNAPNSSVSNSTGVGSYFQCFINTNPTLPGVNVIARSYGQTMLAFPIGWFQWAGDWLNAVVSKAANQVGLIFLYVNAPAQVTGLVWFSYIQAILISFIVIGIIMVVRGS